MQEHLELESQTVGSHLLKVLGTESGSSARVINHSTPCKTFSLLRGFKSFSLNPPASAPCVESIAGVHHCRHTHCRCTSLQVGIIAGVHHCKHAPLQVCITACVHHHIPYSPSAPTWPNIVLLPSLTQQKSVHSSVFPTAPAPHLAPRMVLDLREESPMTYPPQGLLSVPSAT